MRTFSGTKFCPQMEVSPEQRLHEFPRFDPVLHFTNDLYTLVSEIQYNCLNVEI